MSSEISSGFWPFTSPPKEIYIAKIEDEIITKDELLKEIDKLHKSNRAGKSLSKQSSFAKPDYSKFLNEMIDIKLMVVEAKNLGYDKDADFINNMENYALNLFLEKLNQEEILNKVKVEDKEIEDYYQEQMKKKSEEKGKSQETTNIVKTKDNETDASKGQDKKDLDKKDQTPMISPQDRDVIRKGFVNIKAKQREKEYFDELRKKAKVKIDNETLSLLSKDKTELFTKDVALVNGKLILGIDVLREMLAVQQQDENTKKTVLEKLILYSILDQEVLSKGYENDKVIKTKIKKYKEQQLIEQLKKKAILPSIRVDENDILEYYKTNQEYYREPDKANLRIIQLNDKDEANAIFDDLNKGGDFSYLAKEKSADPSGKNGGDVGWVQINQFSDDIQKAIQAAKEGDILGPFEGGYLIIQLRGFEKGGYIPLDKVRREIDIIIGKKRFSSASSNYLKQLRESVKIDINQKEIERIQGN